MSDAIFSSPVEETAAALAAAFPGLGVRITGWAPALPVSAGGVTGWIGHR
ncbi:hypothetical protein ACWGKW_25010 [Streptomyces sp. NPDC054766]